LQRAALRRIISGLMSREPEPMLTRRLLAGTALALPALRLARAQQSLEWVAGSLGGGWYTMAAGLSALIKDENPDIQIRVTPGGGLANATRVNRNQSPMGWGIDAFAASARRGEDPYKEAHTALRCLGSGYSPTEHHFLRAPTTPDADMRAILTKPGVKVGVPQRSSTDEMTLQRILRYLGTSPEKIRADGGTYLNGSYADIAAAYTDGQVDYLYAALAKPAAIFTEIAQGRRSGALVAFPADIRKHLIDQYAYAEGELPAGTYPTLQSGPVPVTLMDSVILVHESVPDDIAYKITKTLIRNRGQRLVAIHASMGAWDPATSVKYQGLPLHPGAIKAFREAGIAVG
jgi:TRAP transporter TAXI family solute receptor